MQNKRILIVDDHELILEITREALAYEGFEVHAINQGREFFDAIKSFRPDLILLDYKLSDANGGELCSEMKSRQELKNIIVIISSAYFNKTNPAKPGGCDGILYKPFDLDELLATVNRHFEPVTVSRIQD